MKNINTTIAMLLISLGLSSQIVSGDSFYPNGLDTTVTPIELISFEVKIINNEVELRWKTASEINNDFFTIERSINGSDWDVIEMIAGAGNSSMVISYETVDSTPYNGFSYYRLKQTDFDGAFTYSKIVSVNILDSEYGTIKYYDLQGREMINKPVNKWHYAIR